MTSPSLCRSYATLLLLRPSQPPTPTPTHSSLSLFTPLLIPPPTPTPTQVIELILSYGGDVIKFAGDSVIVAFYPTPEERGAKDAGLKAATHRALHCAVDLADSLGHMLMLNNGNVVSVTKERYAQLQGEPTSTPAHPAKLPQSES